MLHRGRASAHDAMGQSFMVDPVSYFSFKPVLHNWCNKGCGICFPVFGMEHMKDTLLLFKRVAHVAAAGFLPRYLNGPLPYVSCHITVNKMC